MVADQNRKVDDDGGIGNLIVTRLIAQCDEVVDLINRLSGIKVALARHSKAMVSTDQLASGSHKKWMHEYPDRNNHRQFPPSPSVRPWRHLSDPR